MLYTYVISRNIVIKVPGYAVSMDHSSWNVVSDSSTTSSSLTLLARKNMTPSYNQVSYTSMICVLDHVTLVILSLVISSSHHQSMMMYHTNLPNYHLLVPHLSHLALVKISNFPHLTPYRR